MRKLRFVIIAHLLLLCIVFLNIKSKFQFFNKKDLIDGSWNFYTLVILQICVYTLVILQICVSSKDSIYLLMFQCSINVYLVIFLEAWFSYFDLRWVKVGELGIELEKEERGLLRGIDNWDEMGEFIEGTDEFERFWENREFDMADRLIDGEDGKERYVSCLLVLLSTSGSFCWDLSKEGVIWNLFSPSGLLTGEPKKNWFPRSGLLAGETE